MLLGYADGTVYIFTCLLSTDITEKYLQVTFVVEHKNNLCQVRVALKFQEQLIKLTL